MYLFAKSLSVRLGAVALSSAVLLAGCKKEEPAPAAEAPAAAPAAEAPKPAEEPKPAEPAPAPAAPTPAAPTPADPPAAPTPPAAPAAAPAPQDAAQHPALHDPSKATEKAPDKFTVTFKTTKGDIVIEVKKEWSPLGADRFYNLIKMGYFKDIAFFRVVPGFMAQFGIHGDPTVNSVWKDLGIPDEPVKQSNKKGFLTFAKKGLPNSRSVQFFLNLVDNPNLDGMGFAPFGQIVKGLDVLEKINGEYGEGAPRGRGPDQMRIQAQGNTYLKAEFPNLDYIVSAEIGK